MTRAVDFLMIWGKAFWIILSLSLSSALVASSKIIIGAGMLLVIFGWYQIFQAKGKLVTTGLYKYTRNPQYLGFLMITGGLNVQWLTIITTAIWPVLAILYYRLSKIEEKESETKYGEEFSQYKRTTSRFIPRLVRKHQKKDA